MKSNLHSGTRLSGRPRKVSAHKAEKGLNIFGNENKALITLAVKCRLITIEQETRLLSTLAARREGQPGYTAVDLFRETRILSDESIAFLIAIRHHLEMKMLDKRFGELGVANQFIAPQSVKRALDIQSTIFKETSESKLIGDILLENNEISPADKAAILLTQDRIEDELLPQAMNDIATSEIEKLSLNMRFGAIAVKKGYISLDQLNQALSVQQAEKKDGRPRQYLGHILKDLFNLPDEALRRILHIQKELEKQRLALEEALEKYNSETNINKRLAKTFDYRFSRNKLEAFLRRSHESYEDIKVSHLKRWLNSVGITYGLCPDKEIHDFLGDNTTGSEICIARGVPPQPGQDGRIEFYFDTDIKASEEDTDPALLPLVKKGDAIAQNIFAEPGKPGKDVSGFSLAPPKPKYARLNCGEGVIRDENLFIAETDGIAVLYQNRTLFVKPLERRIPTRHLSGTIEDDLGVKYEGVNLRIEGDILENGMVRCQGLEITGTVLGQVQAAGDITVKGNIGQLPHPGEKPGKPAKIKAEGDIIASKVIANAMVVTSKSLIAPNADLSATAVQAFQDITVKNVLHSDLQPCILQTGKAANLKADSINALIKSKNDKLVQLTCTEAMEELEQWLADKMALKDIFLAQQAFLKCVTALVRFQPLSKLPTMAEKLEAVRKNPGKWPALPELPHEESREWKNFVDEFLADTRVLTLDEIHAYALEQAETKYGMYRAAVNASRRYSLEYEARKKILQKKIQAQQPEIQALEDAIKKLNIRRDTFLMGQTYKSQPVPPAIRVKNRVAKGTMIKGQVAKLVVDQDIHGVKFTESAKTAQEPAQIIIQGYYD